MEGQMGGTPEKIENPLEGGQESLKVGTTEKGTGLVGDQEKGVIGIAIENHHPQGTNQSVDREEIIIDPLIDQKQKTIE